VRIIVLVRARGDSVTRVVAQKLSNA